MDDQPPTDTKGMSREEALAEAWASIDGKLDRFRACKVDPELEFVGGYYGGYMIEAKEMILRLEKRGYTVVPL